MLLGNEAVLEGENGSAMAQLGWKLTHERHQHIVVECLIVLVHSDGK